MAEYHIAESECLGVAIDHRIRRLFKPVISPPQTTPSTHISMLDSMGRRYRRSGDEIKVTKQLAYPPTTGGILVALQQPRNNHPFEKGVEEVISECGTLAALDDLFHAASCGTLGIGINVSVIDLLPYISEQQMRSMGDGQLRDAFLSTTHTFGRKRPDVLLCCGRIWLKRGQNGCKGKASIFENIGIGKTFGRHTTVGFRDETNSWVSLQRVNGFHLSYVINYWPHISCFRQLQLLAVAEACGRYRDDWAEETWMTSLRNACEQRRRLQGEPDRDPELFLRRWLTRADIVGDGPARRIYLPDYQREYSSTLKAIDSAMQLLSASPLSYDDLLESGLSEMYNDASLMLCQMSTLRDKGWPEMFDRLNNTALQSAAEDTHFFLIKQSLHLPRLAANPRLQEIMSHFLSSLRGYIIGIVDEEFPGSQDEESEYGEDEGFPDSDDEEFPDIEDEEFPDDEDERFPDGEDEGFPYSDGFSYSEEFPYSEGEESPDSEGEGIPDGEDEEFPYSEDEGFLDDEAEELPGSEDEEIPLQIDLREAGDEFLNIAKELEALLGDLLELEEFTPDASVCSDSLSELMENLRF